jgi:cytochrome P450
VACVSPTTAQQTGDSERVIAALSAVDRRALSEALQLSDWNDIVAVLRSRDFEPPAKGDGAGIEYQATVVGDTLLDLRGDVHSQRRKIESPLFRSESLRALEERYLLPGLRRAIDELRAQAAAQQPARADLLSLSYRMFFGLMAHLVGIDVDTPEKIDRLTEYFQAIDDAARVKYTTADPAEIARRGQAAQETVMEEFFRPAWRARVALFERVKAGEVNESELPHDFMTVALRHIEHYDQWGPGAVEREATLYIVASVATTATNICHAVCSIEDWIAEHPEDADKRTDEAFVEAALHESLRLYARKWLLRAATRDTQLPTGAAIRQGQLVWLNFEEAYRAIAGEDHDRFDPYRKLSYGRPWGPAFADGRHTCIGKNLVLGDGINEEGGRRGTAKTMMLELYRVGMRLDPDRERVITNESVRQMFVSCPIVLTQL